MIFFSDAEPIPMSSDMLTQPFEGIPSATVQNDQEDNHDILSSEDKSFQQIDVPHTDGEPFDVIKVYFNNQDIFFTLCFPTTSP